MANIILWVISSSLFITTFFDRTEAKQDPRLSIPGQVSVYADGHQMVQKLLLLVMTRRQHYGTWRLWTSYSMYR